MNIIIFVFGLVIGSFLNVVIYRLPKNESIIKPPSYCYNCNKRIKPYDLIPVISYFILGGKCRYCESEVSIRYPLIELITGIIFLLNGVIFSNYETLFTGLIFSSFLIVLAMIDIDHGILPDKITLSGCFVGMVLSILRPDISLLYAISGILAAGGFLFIIALVSGGGMGGGDIKMMMFVGSFTGPLIGVSSIFLGALIGLIANLPGIIKGDLGMKSSLPFGPFLALASLILWLQGDIIWNWYLDLIL